VRAVRHLDFIFLLLALCLFPFLLGRLLVPRAGQGSSLRASRERGHARAGGHAQAGRSDQGHTASRDEPVKKCPGLSVGATGLSLPLSLFLPFLPLAIARPAPRVRANAALRCAPLSEACASERGLSSDRADTGHGVVTVLKFKSHLRCRGRCRA